jgi:hypothetical protein
MLFIVIFNISTSYFQKNWFHYFEDYLMMKQVMSTFYNHGRDLVVVRALNFMCACSEENVC